MDRFQIAIHFGGKVFRMNVRRIFLMADKERWEVEAKNHTFLIDCNRPLMEKKNLAYLAWDFELVSGKCSHYILNEITMAIRHVLTNKKGGE